VAELKELLLKLDFIRGHLRMQDGIIADV
jgi:hypothetical protein